MVEYYFQKNANPNSFYDLHDAVISRRIIKPTLFISIVAALILFAAGYYYEDLGCDGGWYSYPALSKSEGGNVADNLKNIHEMDNRDGIKSIFSFRSYRSIRILYTSLWFKYISKNIYFLKFLSFLEVMFLFVTCYYMLSVFCKDKLILLLLMGIFINDKIIVLNAATDFRPDNMVAAISCLTLFLLIRNTEKISELFLSLLSACLMVTVHVTAVIPSFIIIFFLTLRNIFKKNMVSKESLKYILAGVLALIVFIYRGPIIDFVYSVDKNVMSVSALVNNRILEMWNKGLIFMVNKEIYRWKEYFFITNISPIFVFLLGLFLVLKNSTNPISENATGLSILLSTTVGIFLFGIVDPHRSNVHVIPMVPFFFIILAHGIQSSKKYTKQILYALICIVWISSLSSMALAGKIFIDGQKDNYNICKITKLFEDVFDKKDQKYLVLGPTEIWPFIKSERNVTIIDETRSCRRFEIIEPIVDSIDYVIINNDYSGYEWETRFKSHFANFRLVKSRNVGKKKKFVKIYKIERINNEAINKLD